MGGSSSSSDILKAAKAAMGEHLGQLYWELWGQVAWLHSNWASFTSMFDQKEEQRRILEAIAKSFLFRTHGAFMDSVILHICRLTDPPRSLGKENLTMQRLVDLITEEDLKTQVASAINGLIKKTEFARERRNRRISHLDLLTARGEHPSPFEKFKYKEIDEILAQMADILNLVQKRYLDATTIYDLWDGTGDASFLVECAEKGYRKIEKERNKWLGEGAE